MPVVLVMAPVLPGLWWAAAPLADTSVWAALWADNQWPQALQATLSSAGVGTALACVLAGAAAMLTFPGAGWAKLTRRLPLLLALPHAAFAMGLFFLLSPSGWLARLLAYPLGWAAPPDWVTVQDPHGLALAVALALKESWFLLWVLAAVMGEQGTARHMLVARTLGQGTASAWRHVLWPQLLPRMAWPLAAVWGYSLSVVDMAVVLGPGTPPTAAVLAWQWLTDPNPATQAKGQAAAWAVLGLFGAGVALARLAWTALKRWQPYPVGRAERRAAVTLPEIGNTSGHNAAAWQLTQAALWMPGVLVVAALALWSLAGSWFFPAVLPTDLTLTTWQQADLSPMLTTLWLAAATTLLCLPAALCWLEWGPPRLNALVFAPLVLPALPLVAGQYHALLRSGFDGSAAGVVWSHALWVLPYMVLTLVGAYRALDPRLALAARALGQTRLQACLRVKWPALLRPVLAAVSVGFAVSVAQYLPTLFAGGGRFATVTTEAISLSSGGNRRMLAVQSMLQILLPFSIFMLTTWAAAQAGKWRRGLR
jgi:putative thiamine transport system permease protein